MPYWGTCTYWREGSMCAKNCSPRLSVRARASEPLLFLPPKSPVHSASRPSRTLANLAMMHLTPHEPIGAIKSVGHASSTRRTVRGRFRDSCSSFRSPVVHDMMRLGKLFSEHKISGSRRPATKEQFWHGPVPPAIHRVGRGALFESMVKNRTGLSVALSDDVHNREMMLLITRWFRAIRALIRGENTRGGVVYWKGIRFPASVVQH
ncbi:hypothetical protein B0H67DRAFT_215562 [Lasiosphaeris hirsuta]|uniref:Uncharacterized protein n=1 Tax=Lasiosphaeris hirsuta TaxID=260670 RepID=A0AA40DT54_9PEZI|nr:hypothetical protein B0H67DRAFT_215562 [Lasiosphaeris hirsuta]